MMELMEKILTRSNLDQALKKVRANKGACGIDGISVQELEHYFMANRDKIVESIKNKTFIPNPVRRVYIPKDNGKKRPLGIPTVIDRTIQQAVAQPLTQIYESIFSEYSYGFRPNRSCHDAIKQALNYLKDGYTWIIDIDIEQFFDKVNHDKLIQILREQVKDDKVLNLVRKYLKAGVMEDGFVKATTEGVPQGGPISVILSNIYLDKLDKELEKRGLRFTRYADDVQLYVKSEKAADRVLKSLSKWIEKNLFLKVNETKSKVCRPKMAKYLGFTFLYYKNEWRVKPLPEKVAKLYQNLREYLKRNKACARSIAVTFTRVNQIVRGWINYYRIGTIKTIMVKLGEWLRHKLRVIIIKQWKKPKTIMRNLQYINRKYKFGISDELIRQTANTRLGWYRMCGMRTVNFILSPSILEKKVGNRPALVNPLKYYLG